MIKTTLLSTSLILMCPSVFAQTKKPVSKVVAKKTVAPKDTIGVLPSRTIIGIGPFRINKMPLDSLALIVGMAAQPDSSMDYLKSTDTELFSLRDYTGSYSRAMTRDFSYREQFVDGYKIRVISNYRYEDLRLGKVEMLFKDDTLIRFYSDNDFKLNDILELKYGKGKDYTKLDTISCVYKMTGASVEYEEVANIRTWKAGDVTISTYFEKKYDQKCEPQYYKSFTMEDDAKYKVYQDLVKARRKSLYEAKNAENLKKY